jgi:hypothetical protein
VAFGKFGGNSFLGNISNSLLTVESFVAACGLHSRPPPGEYLKRLERTRFLAPPEADVEMDGLDETEKNPRLKTPCGGQRNSCDAAGSGNSFNPKRR